MPVYIWKGKNSYGEKRKGEVEAPDQAAALNHVKRMRITNPVIKEKPKDLFENIALFKPKVTGKEIVIFTRQMSTMIDAGLPLVQCLEILAKQQENATLKKILTEVQLDVESGTTFADAMRKHPKAFDTLFCNMIEAGETGGILDTILSRLAIFMEKSMALKKKIKGAMTYPTICLAISLLILTVILVFVIPVFSDMFKTFGSTLPAPTLLVINMSDFFKAYFFYIFAALFFIIALKKNPGAEPLHPASIPESSKGAITDVILIVLPEYPKILLRLLTKAFLPMPCSPTISKCLKLTIPSVSSLIFKDIAI